MKAVMVFGRFQPPTKAHEQIFGQLLDLAFAHNATPFIFCSTSYDGKKNPLPWDKKVAWIKLVAPHHNVVPIKNPCMALHWLASGGYKDVLFVAGSDRLSKYVDFVQYIDKATPEETRINLDSLKLFSAGGRDSESEAIAGVSATKARELARAGDYESFRTMVPTSFNEENTKQIYMDVRRGLGL